MKRMRYITTEGLNLERFICLMGEKGIPLHALHRAGPRQLRALVQPVYVRELQEIAMTGGWKLTVGGWNSSGWLVQQLQKRWMICFLMPALLLLLFCATGVIWRIDIAGGGTYSADMKTALEELGVHVPMRRSGIDLGELRDALEWRYPNIAWIECGFRGITLTIKVENGLIPITEKMPPGACDVIASRDAVIARIITRAGTPVVEPGDIVHAGDILIRGEERTADGGGRVVAARGSVMARVWQGAAVRLPATEYITEYTGQQQVVWTLRTPWFDLWRLPESAYEQQDVSISTMPVGGIFVPMVLYKETRMEAEVRMRIRDEAELKNEAWTAAERKLRKTIHPDESLIDIWGNCSMIDDENVLSVAIGELLVEIGIRSDCGMAAAQTQALADAWPTE